MKKFVLRFWIVILTFAVGITSTIIWLKYNPFIESYENINFSEIPSVAYCDLKNNPRKYDGKIIRIKYVKLYFFTHGYFLADENCLGEEDLGRTAINVYEPNQDLLWNTMKQFHQKDKMWEPVEIVVVGRFTYKNRLGGSDGIEDRTHLQFEIYEFENIKR